MTSKKIEELTQIIKKYQFGPGNSGTLSELSQVSLNYAQQLLDENNGEHLSAFSALSQANYQLYANQQMRISGLNFQSSAQGQNRSEEDEYIEVLNQGPVILNLNGWRIEAGPNQSMTFKEDTFIKNGQSIRIYTFNKEMYSFDSRQPIWNNRGDKAKLFDEKASLISQWLYGRDAEQDVDISHIAFNGKEKYSDGDEYVEIANLSPAWIDIANWALGGGHAEDFIFPEGSHIAPFASIRVYTNKVEPITGGYSWNSRRAIWNNESGHAYLKGLGQSTVSDYHY